MAGQTGPAPADEDPSEQRRYRAYIQSADGKIEDIPPDKVTGIDQFLDSWQRSPETPQELTGSGWQGPDDAHPPDTGQPAYRIVYKTLKIIPYPRIDLVWPNLKVAIQNGDIIRGGMTAPTSVPGRSPRHHVIPEYGRVVPRPPQGVQYLPCPNMNLQMAGWEETIEALSYVEIIVHIEDVQTHDYEEIILKGRRAVASLKTLLDLKLGPRLLAMPITEEAGETFDDWHWNRRLNTGLVSAESQAAMRQLEAGTITNEIVPLIERYQDLPDNERRRLTLACQWYWRADAETDQTTRFISWWLVVESLEMVKTTDVRPIREQLGILFGNDERAWRQFVGRLYGLRSRVFHGEEWEVPNEPLRRVELLARVLLAARLLGTVPNDVKQEFLEAAGMGV